MEARQRAAGRVLALVAGAALATAPAARAQLPATPAARAQPPATPAARARSDPWSDPSPHRVRRVAVEPGVGLEVLDWGGPGEAMVFLPGLGNTAHAFDTFAPRFSDAFHVYGITPRGFGDSGHPEGGYDSATRANDILAVLDSLHIRRAILVGHSIAGDELSRFGAEHPERVRALIYLDAYSYGTDGFKTTLPPPPPLPRPPMTSADSASLAGVADYSARLYGFRMPEGEILANTPPAERGQVPRIGAVPNASGRVLVGTQRSDYARIRSPALAIYALDVNPRQLFPHYGAYDALGRERADSIFSALRRWQTGQIQRFRNEVVGGEVVEIPGAKHYVHYSNADQVEQIMRSFLTRIMGISE